MTKGVKNKTSKPTPGSTQATSIQSQTGFGTPLFVDSSPNPLKGDPDRGMESRIKKHVTDAAKKLSTHLYDLEDILEADKKSERRNIKAVSQSLKEGQGRVDKRLDELMKGMEKQLELIQRLNQSMGEAMEQINKIGKKRSASEAFEVNDDDNEDKIRTRTFVDHTQFKQLERRLGLYVSNTQTHIESAVCEMKAGTLKRMADLNERVGAMEDKMDRMARSMAKWEAARSANTGPSAL